MKNSYNTWFFCVLFFIFAVFYPIKDVQLGFHTKIIGFYASSSPHQLRVPLVLTWRIPQQTPVWDTSSSQLGQGGNSMKQQHNLSWVLRPSPVALLINHMLAKLGEVVCIYYYPTVRPNHSTGMMTNDQPETVIFFCGKTCSSANQEPLKFRVFSGFPSWLKRSFLICTAITQKTYGSLQFHNHPGSPKSDQKFTAFLWSKIVEVVYNLDIFNPGPAGKIGIWNDLDG